MNSTKKRFLDSVYSNVNSIRCENNLILIFRSLIIRVYKSEVRYLDKSVCFFIVLIEFKDDLKVKFK